MRNLNLHLTKIPICFYCLLLILLVAGCKKEAMPQPDTDGMFLSAYKNNDDFWISNEPYASISKNDNIIWVGGYKNPGNNNSDNEEVLLMQLNIIDLSNLKNTTIKSVDYSFIKQGDIVSDRYIIDTTNANNEIVITEIDETKKTMKGKFSLNLIRDKWFSNNGEKTAFKSGEFVTTYTEN